MKKQLTVEWDFEGFGRCVDVEVEVDFDLEAYRDEEDEEGSSPIVFVSAEYEDEDYRAVRDKGDEVQVSYFFDLVEAIEQGTAKLSYETRTVGDIVRELARGQHRDDLAALPAG